MPGKKSVGHRFLVGLFLLLAVFFALEPVCVEASGLKRIGVMWFGNEVRYAELNRGVVDQLAKEGFQGAGVKFFVENAGGSKARAAELARKFASQKLDLIFAFGTSAASAVATEIKDVPLVCAVYDPVEAGIAQEWKGSGNNTTGVSPKCPMAKLVGSLKELAPVRKLGVLYTPHEKNSEAVLKELIGIQDASHVRIIPVPLTRDEDITELLPEVLRAVDAIFLTGSGIVGKNAVKIVDAATRARVVTVTHLEDLAKNGVLLSMASDQYLMGRLAGKKGARILRGAKPSSLPYETLPVRQLDLILNLKTAQKGNFRIAPSFMKKVTKTIE